jgi:phage shock protein PspC (stress-responsive transcriptional regulator)
MWLQMEIAMAMADELAKLEELHQRGALSDEEFARAKAKLLDDAPARATGSPALDAINAFRRSRTDRWLAGVCGGLAKSTGMESWAWRLVFAVLALFGGAGLLIYVLLWIFVPSE